MKSSEMIKAVAKKTRAYEKKGYVQSKVGILNLRQT